MTQTRATLIGFTAVLLWALLALFTVGAVPVPPLQLNAICFALGGVIGMVWVSMTGGWSRLRRVPLGVYVFGTAGLFGYHFFYFSAFRLAPAAEAGLIAYLWPLLIVLFSGFLPGERLRAGHVIGALVSFVGAGLLITRGADGFDMASLPGYAFAALCALTWSGYSVLSRRLGAQPTDSVAIFCIATAVLSALTHLVFEDTAWPTRTMGWLAVIGLGLGPVGLAFYTWDVGVKRGNIQLLGTASYAAPLLSTIALILAGVARPSPVLIFSAFLITAGAILAARAGRKA